MSEPSPAKGACERPHTFLLYGAHDPESTRRVPYTQIGTHPRYPTLARREAVVWELVTRYARADETPDLWAFWSYADFVRKTPSLGLIYPHLKLLEVCMPYGLDAAVAHGQGEVVTLVITEARLWSAPPR